MKNEYEFVVVGSGAGGATVAKELSQRGRRVIVVEKGNREESVGTFRDALRYYDASKLLKVPRKSREGVVLWRTVMAGGSTMVSCGNGTRALEAELAELGIDLTDEFREVENELGVAPLNVQLLSPGGQRLREAAAEVGYRFEPMPKFIDQEQCLRCSHCTLGCRIEAKWTALDPLKAAEQAGAEVRYGIDVESVIIEDGIARGIQGMGPEGPVEIRGETTVLAAGALGTPVILQRSGIEAGNGLFVDLFVNVYGVADVSMAREPQMSLVDREFHDTEGFILSPFLHIPREVRFIEAGVRGAVLPLDRTLGLMVKITDERTGRVDATGTVSKGVTGQDQDRLDAGVAVAQEILIEAGARPDSIIVTKVQGAHPGGTAAIGEVVDRELRTSVEGLYVGDASVLPESAGLPPILTIVSLAKRLARQLDDGRTRDDVATVSDPDA